MIDLHMHSTFSDGSLTPEELVAMGRKIGLKAMALTDHDCMSGVPRFLAACAAAGMDGVAGVEISAEVPRGTLHMLGYFVQPGQPFLEDALHRIRAGRELRNAEILRKLNAMGLELTWEEVAKHAGEDVVGRPHFSQALIARGYARDKQDVFDRLLAKGKPAYVDRFRMTPADSIAAIIQGGGMAVMAHPSTMELGRKGLKKLVGELKESGLQGIEVFYAEHSQEQVCQYLNLAREFDLVATGGADFHGEANRSVKMGTGFGSLEVPDEVMVALRARLGQRAAGRS
jgi:predicted metal-dependent phosphoesterase TrpH